MTQAIDENLYMKRWMLYSIPLIVPFLILVVVNALFSNEEGEKAHRIATFKAANTGEKIRSKCTWACHNDTNFCKTNHVQLMNPYFDVIDPIYFGIIRGLKATGDYGLANIIVLVLVLPMIMYFLLIQSIRMYWEIKALKEDEVE